MRQDKRKKQWVVSIERPEEIHKHPSLYYTSEAIEKYARSGGMKRAQQRIAYRIIELLKLKQGARLLDLGCGVGYTTSVYKNKGYDVIGIDILPMMLEKAREKGLRVVKGNMTDIQDLFDKDSFDGVVSASAIQWLNKDDLAKTAKGISHILKPKGRLIIQFYPKSEQEMKDTARIFKKTGFKGIIIIDNPDNSKKRVIYLAMRKV